MLVSYFSGNGEEYDVKKLAQQLPRFNADTVEDIHAKVAAGDLSEKAVFGLLCPQPKRVRGSGRRKILERDVMTPGGAIVPSVGNKPGGGLINGLLPGMPYRFARCCHPVFGDAIRGIINTGTGITVHANSCRELKRYAGYKGKGLELAWNVAASGSSHYTGRLSLLVDNRPGILAGLSSLLIREDGVISNVKVINRSLAYMEFLVDVEAKSTEHIEQMIAVLKQSPHVKSAERFFNK
jgi:GTP pyrophosphokinase